MRDGNVFLRKRHLSLNEVAQLLDRTPEFVRLMVIEGDLVPVGKEVYGSAAPYKDELIFERGEVSRHIKGRLRRSRDIGEQLDYLVAVVGAMAETIQQLREKLDAPEMVDLKWISKNYNIHRVTLQNRIERLNGSSGVIHIKGLCQPVPCQKVERQWKVRRSTLENIWEKSQKVLTLQRG